MSTAEWTRALAHEYLVRLAADAGWTITRSGTPATVASLTGGTVTNAPPAYAPARPVGRNRAERRSRRR